MISLIFILYSDSIDCSAIIPARRFRREIVTVHPTVVVATTTISTVIETSTTDLPIPISSQTSTSTKEIDITPTETVYSTLMPVTPTVTNTLTYYSILDAPIATTSESSSYLLSLSIVGRIFADLIHYSHHRIFCTNRLHNTRESFSALQLPITDSIALLDCCRSICLSKTIQCSKKSKEGNCKDQCEWWFIMNDLTMTLNYSSNSNHLVL